MQLNLFEPLLMPSLLLVVPDKRVFQPDLPLVVEQWLLMLLPFNQMQLRVQPQLHQGIDLNNKNLLQGLNLEEMQASETVVKLLYLDLLLWVRLFLSGRFYRLFSCGQFGKYCCSRSC